MSSESNYFHFNSVTGLCEYYSVVDGELVEIKIAYARRGQLHNPKKSKIILDLVTDNHYSDYI